MKKAITLFLYFYTIFGYGQYSNIITWEDSLKNYLNTYTYADTFYIDPNNFGDTLEDGSILHPFDSWEDFQENGGLESYTCYLQKRGTTDTVLITYIGSPTLPVTHIKVGSYGIGEIPAILTKKDPTAPLPRLGHKDGLFNIRGGSSYIIFENIKLTGGPGDELGYDPVLRMGINIDGQIDPNADWVTNIVIDSVEVRYSGSGIILPNSVGAYVDSILIDNCHIHDALSEGLFGGRSNATVRNCSIYDISMGIIYGGIAGGDACQLSPKERNGDCGKMKYIGNYIDRSATINKFCIIHNSTGTSNGAELYIIGNTFYPPRDTGGYAGSALYLRLADMYIYGNKFIGRGYDGDPVGAIAYIEARKDFYFVGNLIDSVSVFQVLGENNDKNQWIMNNTFANIQKKGPALFNVLNDSIHFYGNLFTLHGDLDLIGGNAETLTTYSNNITIIGDSLSWENHFTDWENQEYSLKIESSAIDGSLWKKEYYKLWENDLAGTAVPQINGNVNYNSEMDIGAVQYDDGAVPSFAPIPAFSTSEKFPMVNDQVTFTDKSSLFPTNWSWVFEGGNPNTSTQQNPIVTYNIPGEFNIQLTVSNSDGSEVMTKEDYINVGYDRPVLIITEVLPNPSDVMDSDGEWFEIYNPTNFSIDMKGWTIKDDGSDFHIIDSTKIVMAKSFIVLGNNAEPSENGGYFCNYAYSNFSLNDIADQILLLNPQGEEIDRIVYDMNFNWPSVIGSSMVFIGSENDDNNDSNFWETPTIRELSFIGSSGAYGSPGTNGYSQNLDMNELEFKLHLNAFLEGAFNVLEMNNLLFNKLPLWQPYDATPFNYHGHEQVINIPEMNIVDWVLVELRDASSANFASRESTIAKKAAFIKTDGSIVDLDGISPLTFNKIASNSLFVVIKHRNHLGVLSANPVTESGGYYSYDFTGNSENTYGGILGIKELPNNNWGLVSGDSNSDGVVDLTDKIYNWYSHVGLSGYYSSDHNLDTQADNKDKDDVWLINVGRASQVPD